MNNNNMMQINNNNEPNKKKGFFSKLKEKKEKKKLMKEALNTSNSSMSFNNSMGPSIKSKVVTAEEARDKKWKIKRIIRNILTIPELILVVFLGMKLKEVYIDYSNNVHQTIKYNSSTYNYEIHRDDNSIKVSKMISGDCSTSQCLKTISNYEIKYGKNEMFILHTFFDITFWFKNGDKTITLDDLKIKYLKNCFYSMIYNDRDFIFGKTYKEYSIIDFNQMSSYTKKGFQLLDQNNIINLYIAIGEKKTSGYNLNIYNAFISDGNLVFYVYETSPSDTESISMITHPVLRIMLKEHPKSITIIDIDTGEVYEDYDSMQQARMITSKAIYMIDLIKK